MSKSFKRRSFLKITLFALTGILINSPISAQDDNTGEKVICREEIKKETEDLVNILTKIVEEHHNIKYTETEKSYAITKVYYSRLDDLKGEYVFID